MYARFPVGAVAASDEYKYVVLVRKDVNHPKSTAEPFRYSEHL